MEQYNDQNLTELQVFVDIISTRDAFKIARLSEFTFFSYFFIVIVVFMYIKIIFYIVSLSINIYS